jgi:uncharacterized membrane protein
MKLGMDSGIDHGIDRGIDAVKDFGVKPTARSQRLTYSVTINKPAIAVYRAWYDLARRQSQHIDVQRPGTAATRRQSVIKAPYIGDAGGALLVDEIPGVLISWESLPSAPVRQLGEVWFNANTLEQATEVRVTLSWKPDSESSNDISTRAAGAQLEQDLVRFKHLMEH